MTIKRNKLTYEQITSIRELSNMGVNAYQIAKKLGIASSVARYHIKAMVSSKHVPIVQVQAPLPLNDVPRDNDIIALLKEKNKALLEIITHQLSA